MELKGTRRHAWPQFRIQINTWTDRPSPINTTANKFRVRCFQPLSHLSVAAKGANAPSVGGYLSAATGREHSGFVVRFARGQQLTVSERKSSRGHALADPADDQIGDLQVVPVHHQDLTASTVATQPLRRSSPLGPTAPGCSRPRPCSRSAAVSACHPPELRSRPPGIGCTSRRTSISGSRLEPVSGGLGATTVPPVR